MIQKTRIKMNGKEYDSYKGTHTELRDMLKVNDLVTLRRQNSDNTESIEIVGTVNRILHDSVFVLVNGLESLCQLCELCDHNIRSYEFLVTLIRRPVKDKLPDHAGLWRDKDGDVWCVNNNLNAICVKSDGCWDFRGYRTTNCEYKKYAPFTELTITEKEHTDEHK